MRSKKLPYVYMGWDHPPQQCDDAGWRRRSVRATDASIENAIGPVLREIGLTLAMPLALAVVVEAILQACHVA